MSIASELARLQQAKSDIKIAIEAKGVSVPSSATLDTYDDYVAAIVTGGGGGGIPMPSNLDAVTLNADGYPVSVTLKDGTSATTTAYKGNTMLTSVTIPSSVTTVANESFSECNRITTISFENGSILSGIGANAFHHCSGLTSISIPSGVTSLGSYAFASCTGLTTFAIPSETTSVADNVLCWCTSLTSISIPSGVTSIGINALAYCGNLSSVTFESGSELSAIPDGCFIGCGKLQSIVIPSGVTSIGNSAFRACTSFDAVTLPDALTTIGDSAFSGTSLTTISIPSGVTSIGNDSFVYISTLTTVYALNPTPTTFASYAYPFGFSTSNLTIYVPSESVSAYEAADGWNKYNIQAIPSE